MNKYFTHYEIPGKLGKIFVVVEHYSENNQKVIGVATGVESVIVINSGMGMTGDVRKYVEDILGTDKTIECVALTGQTDNVGALSAFDFCYLEPSEQETYCRVGSDPKTRRNLLKQLCEGNAETIAYGEHLTMDNRGIRFLPAGHGIDMGNLEVSEHMFDQNGDGFMYHLGGTVVEMASLPAQSKGQLVAISPTCCVSFVGTAIEPITRLDTLDRTGLEAYTAALEKFFKYSIADTPFSEGLGRTPHIYFTDHSAIPMQVKDVQNILDACREVLAGKTEGDMPAGQGALRRIHFVENNGIVYDANRIRS